MRHGRAARFASLGAGRRWRLRRKHWIAVGLAAWAGLAGAARAQGGASPRSGASFGDVVRFVDGHSRLLVLRNRKEGSAVAVWPAMQGRVLTSSAAGYEGHSFGWYNRDLIASGKPQPHMNAVGGEDRLWLGPEGGQFGVFFAPGVPFDLAHWYTPAPIDTEPFAVVRQSADRVSLRRRFELTNYSGTHFAVQVDRQVRLLSPEQTWQRLGVAPVAGIKVVGFESENTLTNVGPKAWSKTGGLLSLWVLGQFQADATSSIILPIRKGPEASLGIPVTTDLFGPVPPERVRIGADAVLFKADANYRAKMGLSSRRSKGVMGSYDPENHVLTVVQWSEPAGAAEYVNSAWKIQKEPYNGDVANCYNDGAPAAGKPGLGHFYEMESSSPAEALAPEGRVEHTQRTMHLVGSEADLEPVAERVLGVKLADVVRFSR